MYSDNLQIVKLHEHYDEDHLDVVINQMREMGSPTLRAVHCGSYIQLLEGCHRVRAAEALGLPINIILYSGEDPDREVLEDIPDLQIDPQTWESVTRYDHRANPLDLDYEIVEEVTL